MTEVEDIFFCGRLSVRNELADLIVTLGIEHEQRDACATAAGSSEVRQQSTAAQRELLIPSGAPDMVVRRPEPG